jgi:alanine-synthesizing transaminase
MRKTRDVFSNRLGSRSLTENPIARALRSRGRPYDDLTESNPTRVGLSPSLEGLRNVLEGPGLESYVPDPRGLPTAREAISKYYRDRDAKVDPGRIVLTASTSEAYGYLFKLLCDPGDCVLVPAPSYPLFEYLTDLETVRRAVYPLDPESRWGVGRSAIEKGLAQGARALLTVHPNNPTGSFLTRDELGWLDAVLGSAGAALICDEVFLDYAFDSDRSRAGVAAAAARNTLTFSLGGLSKSCGLPQLKLAWIAAGGPAALVEAALQRLELIADTYLSVSTPVQRVLPLLLPMSAPVVEKIRARVQSNLVCLDGALANLPASLGVHRLPLEGGWYATLRVPAVQSEESLVLGLLESQDVLVQPGFFYDFPSEAFLVVSLIAETAKFRRAAVRLAGGVGELLA